MFQAFQQAVTNTNSRYLLDSWDSNIIQIKTEDKTKFIDGLIAIMSQWCRERDPMSSLQNWSLVSISANRQTPTHFYIFQICNNVKRASNSPKFSTWPSSSLSTSLRRTTPRIEHRSCNHFSFPIFCPNTEKVGCFKTKNSIQSSKIFWKTTNLAFSYFHIVQVIDHFHWPCSSLPSKRDSHSTNILLQCCNFWLSRTLLPEMGVYSPDMLVDLLPQVLH